MVEENVIAQLNNIKTHPCVAVGLRNNALRLHGWVYDIESGEIRTWIKTAKPTFPLQKTHKCISSNSSTGARMLWTSPPLFLLVDKNGLATSFKVATGVPTSVFAHFIKYCDRSHFLSRKQLFIHGAGDKGAGTNASKNKKNNEYVILS